MAWTCSKELQGRVLAQERLTVQVSIVDKSEGVL